VKLPHVLGFGSVGIGLAEAQAPTRDGVTLPAPGPLPEGPPLPALGALVEELTEVGTSTLVVCSNPQADVINTATARLARTGRDLII
jgi:hypothetical protein